MFKKRFRFVGREDVVETDVIIVPADEWPLRPESASPLWLVTDLTASGKRYIVAVRDAIRHACTPAEIDSGGGLEMLSGSLDKAAGSLIKPD